MVRIPRLIVLNLTSDCNMRCKYCYASAGIKKDYMSFDIAQKIVDEMLQINDGKKINVLFHGGEPLLCYEVIKKLVYYSEEKYKDCINYYIQTDGVLLDDEKIVFFLEHNVKISLSVDGCDEKTNAYRVLENGENSIKYIQKAISRLLKRNVECTALAVLNKANYDEIEKIISFFVHNQIYSFAFNYFIKGGRGESNSQLAINTEELFESTVKITKVLQTYRNKGINIQERNVYYLLKSIKENKKRFMCANSPCGAGLNIIGITPNGDVYPCDDLSSQEKFKIGNIKEKNLVELLDNNEIIIYFASCNLNRIEECQKCRLQEKCGAGCCSRKYYETGTIYSKDPICDFYKKIIPYLENEIYLGRLTI